MSDASPKWRVTVTGSFNKHWLEVTRTIEEFRGLDMEVASPPSTERVRQEDGFWRLTGDTGSAADIERRHLEAIRQSDALYVVNPGGYLGSSAALEMGYALACGTPIWVSEGFGDLPHDQLVRVGPVLEAVRFIRAGKLEAPSSDGLIELQDYVRRMARKRGFDEEEPEQILILLMEEVGELAKAMRSRLRLMMSESDKSSKNVTLELADCFIYILHLANKTDVNLFRAFKEKERLNAAKKWVKPH